MGQDLGHMAAVDFPSRHLSDRADWVLNLDIFVG